MTNEERIQYIERLQKFKSLRKRFANQYNYSERIIQNSIDKFCDLIISKDGTITTDEFIDIASNQDSVFYELFDWNSSTEEKRKRADELFELFEYFFTANNKLYRLIRS